jgi:hypothetical protein
VQSRDLGFISEYSENIGQQGHIFSSLDSRGPLRVPKVKFPYSGNAKYRKKGNHLNKNQNS